MKIRNIFHRISLCFILSIFLTVAGFSQNAAVYNYQVLNQPVNDLIYSSKRKLLYASVPSTGGVYGNHIIAINPYTKQLVNSVFVGSEPNKLAVSDDGQFLYVGLDGSAQVRKVLLETLTADISFGLGTGSFGLHYPEDIAVLPNQPNTIAVSRRNLCCSPRHEGVAIFENGVMRPTVTPGHTGSNVIEAGENENVLYGYNNETTEFGFRRMAVNASGVSTTSVLQNAVSGFGVDIRYSNGRIYSTTGRIVNTATNTLDGTFAVSGSVNGIVPDAKTKRVFFQSGNMLQAFNSANFQPAGSLTLANSGHSLSRLIRWGKRGLAYRTSDGRFVIFETSLVPSQPNTSDFNGDEIADYAVFRPNGGLWFATSGIYAYPFGISTDVPVANDYDGDFKTDLAVYREGIWYVLNSQNQTVSITSYGLSTDKPVAADYDGDHKTDFAVYRNGTWYILQSSNSQSLSFNFGLSTDKPVPADYDGDGKTDYAVFRPNEGNWYVLTSATSQIRVFGFGNDAAQPAPADYDGDNIADYAVWQNTFGQLVYYVFQSSNNQVREILLDSSSQTKPFPMDIDGDGVADPTVFNQNGQWSSQKSTNGNLFNFAFGTNGDKLISGN